MILFAVQIAFPPLRLQAKAGYFAFHERQVQLGGGENEADVTHMLVLAAFAQEFQLAQDYVLGRRNPGLAPLQADPAAVRSAQACKGSRAAR